MDRVDLAALLRAAAAGRFPPVDGGVSRARPWREGVEAAVAFTGHAVLAVCDDMDDEELLRLGAHGYGGAHDPRLVTALVGEGEIGVLDVLLVGRGTGASPGQACADGPADGLADGPGGGPSPGDVIPLVPRPDLADSERACHARLWRDKVQVLGLRDARTTGVATLSRGIAGLTEVGVQAQDGSADALLSGALAQVPRSEVLLASVTPGNARSLRFFLRRGFVPVGSVQQWRPKRHAPCG